MFFLNQPKDVLKIFVKIGIILSIISLFFLKLFKLLILFFIWGIILFLLNLYYLYKGIIFIYSKPDKLAIKRSKAKIFLIFSYLIRYTIIFLILIILIKWQVKYFLATAAGMLAVVIIFSIYAGICAILKYYA